MNATLAESLVDRGEHSIVESLEKWFVAQRKNVRREVPNMGRSIDLVVTSGRWVTAVEAKLNKWRQGLIQCDSHRTVADYIVIAVALKSIPLALEDAVQERGYGLIQCNIQSDDCRWIVMPRRNMGVWSPQRKEFSKRLRMIQYVD